MADTNNSDLLTMLRLLEEIRRETSASTVNVSSSSPDSLQVHVYWRGEEDELLDLNCAIIVTTVHMEGALTDLLEDIIERINLEYRRNTGRSI